MSAEMQRKLMSARYIHHIHILYIHGAHMHGWKDRWIDGQMDTVVYIPYIMYINYMHTQHEYPKQYLDTNTVYMHSIHSKTTWTDG